MTSIRFTPTDILIFGCAVQGPLSSPIVIRKLLEANADINHVSLHLPRFSESQRDWLFAMANYNVHTWIVGLGPIEEFNVAGSVTALSNAIDKRGSRDLIQNLLDAKADIETVCFRESNRTVLACDNLSRYQGILQCTPDSLNHLDVYNKGPLQWALDATIDIPTDTIARRDYEFLVSERNRLETSLLQSLDSTFIPPLAALVVSYLLVAPLLS